MLTNNAKAMTNVAVIIFFVSNTVITKEKIHFNIKSIFGTFVKMLVHLSKCKHPKINKTKNLPKFITTDFRSLGLYGDDEHLVCTKKVKKEKTRKLYLSFIDV